MPATRLPCDLVIIGKGVLPVAGLHPQEQMTVDLGVVVDDYLQTERARHLCRR